MTSNYIGKILSCNFKQKSNYLYIFYFFLKINILNNFFSSNSPGSMALRTVRFSFPINAHRSSRTRGSLGFKLKKG